MTAIVADRLTKRFGDFAAVDGVSFEIPAGQLVALLGPNGAGKTTTLEMLEGFLAPTSGTARVLGTAPHHGDRRTGSPPSTYLPAGPHRPSPRTGRRR
jgi:ABC-2 type transport system ATP-binding protein